MAFRTWPQQQQTTPTQPWRRTVGSRWSHTSPRSIRTATALTTIRNPSRSYRRARTLPSAIGGGHKRNTKALLKKLDGELMYQWGEAMKQFRKTQVPPQIVSVFGCDTDTAQVIWLKLQLRAAFPMTYAEALDPAGGNATLG